jgi:hypothetical protein
LEAVYDAAPFGDNFRLLHEVSNSGDVQAMAHFASQFESGG